ncbi:hypothetical protein HN709_02865 [Candidatus Peregrinibacteria bacterium]|nr:hypothetical protein [Candidatus Peregrinibacteria bacterium]MBT7736606.1 hypothetical protein [Candidatus Peregrinibacteria bacterium]
MGIESLKDYKGNELPDSVKELVGHMRAVRRLYQDQIAKDCIGIIPFDDQSIPPDDIKLTAERAVKQTQTIEDLLLLAGGDEQVQKMAESLNEVYQELLGETIPTVGMATASTVAVEKLFNGDPKYQELYRRQQELENKLVLIEGKKREAVLGYFVDVLKEPPKDHVIDKMFQGDSMAQMEMMVLTMSYYHDAIDQVLSLPNDERAEKIAQFEKAISFYKNLSNGDLRKDWIKKLGEKAEQMKESEKQDGLRKVIGDGKDFLQDQMDSALTLLFGGSEESLLVWMHQKAVSLERDLSRPIQPNDPEVLQALEDELVEALDGIGSRIDPLVLDMASNACRNVRGLPSGRITYSEAKVFKDAMGAFLTEVVFPTQERIINAHSEIMTNAYMYSHGTDSMMTSDSLFRGKLAQMGGQDVWRTLQVFSPFGIALPDGVELKPYEERFSQFDAEMSKEGNGDDCFMYWSEGGVMFPKAVKGWNTFTHEQKQYFFKTKRRGGLDKIKIKSYWETGFWKDHELLSVATQGGLTYLTVDGPIGVYYLGKKAVSYAVAKGLIRGTARKTAGKIAGKTILKKAAGRAAGYFVPGVNIALTIWTLAEIGDFIDAKMLEGMDEDFREDVQAYLDEYGTGSQWPKEKAQDIRFRLLRSVLKHKRTNSRSIGYDLQKFGMPFHHMFDFMGGALFRDSMVETGEFREALIETNFILNSIGLDPFTVEIDL